MSDNVVDLAKAREEREPHWAGIALCLHCRHEWDTTAPMDTLDRLECPSCGTHRGAIKNNFGAAVGDAVLTCRCGCTVLTAVRRVDAVRLICVACGTDLLNVL